MLVQRLSNSASYEGYLQMVKQIEPTVKKVSVESNWPPGTHVMAHVRALTNFALAQKWQGEARCSHVQCRSRLGIGRETMILWLAIIERFVAWMLESGRGKLRLVCPFAMREPSSSDSAAEHPLSQLLLVVVSEECRVDGIRYKPRFVFAGDDSARQVHFAP